MVRPPPGISTQLIEGADPRLVLDDAEIRVVSGPDKGARIALAGQSILIGADPSCDLVLHDPTVSSRHAEVVATDSGYSIRDLGSANGLVSGKLLVERAPLAAGTRWRLGATVLAVRALGTTTTLALAPAGRFGGLVAHSVKMRAAVEMLKRVAESDATLLLEGETGTGKEVAATAVHAASPRARGPLVVFDCGGIPGSMMSAELLGHERGAFTGADSARAGLFEQADGGTLFIDEVGELPLDAQPVFLGALERKRARRVGGDSARGFDVRVIAATSRNLAEEVAQGRFREDLYYRLAVARVRLPPLRERKEDLLPLAEELAAEVDVALTPEIRALLVGHTWPGNVRELRNAMTRLMVDPSAARALDVGPTASAIREGDRVRPLADARRLASDAFEREYLAALWEAAGESLGRAAELAGTSRQHLGRLLDRHGIRSYQDKGSR